MTELKVRPVCYTRHEYRQIAAVEAAAYADRGVTHHRNRVRQVRTLVQAIPGTSGRVVVDCHDAVRGWILWAERPARVREVMALAVHPDWQDLGAGRLLLGQVLAQVRDDPRVKVGVFVPDDLWPLAPQFFLHFGFSVSGRHDLNGDGELFTRFLYRVRQPVVPLKRGKR